MVDTYWVKVKGKIVEVFQEKTAGTYRAVNPEEHDGIICRGPEKVFLDKLEIEREG